MGRRTVTDMMGRSLDVPELPQRIVSLVPSQTELLHDLGLEEEVVGITKFCIHPDAWFRSKTRVGGTKQVHADRVAALQPDLIIANKEENVKEQIEALSAIAPVWVSDIRDIPEAVAMIRAVGDLCGKAEQGAAIADAIAHGFGAFRKPVVPKRVAYAIWRDPWMWAGGDTFIHAVLEAIGFQNVLASMPRYPVVTPEELAALAPELVLLSSEPYPFKEKHIEELRLVLGGTGGTPAPAEVRLVDGEMFSWYGSRLVKAVLYLQQLVSEV